MFVVYVDGRGMCIGIVMQDLLIVSFSWIEGVLDDMVSSAVNSFGSLQNPMFDCKI